MNRLLINVPSSPKCSDDVHFHKNGPGNVDHILWVTMSENGPRIGQITLDGVYDRVGRDLEVKELYNREREEN